MAFDLVIRGGTVVDGSGRPAYEADVMVKGDRIAAIGRHAGSAGEVIDARGKLVTPGFIDIHTHLDAQITWDPLAAPASFHGITSVVMGNCGVGFAPCRPADRDYLMFLMEGVEDVPQDCMRRAMPWEWESFPEYLRFLDRRPLGINVGAHLTHAPVRVWAMGKRGASDLRALVMIALHNSDMRASAAMMVHPLSTPGLGDAGAHTSQTCDVGVGTFTLAYWARDRGLLTIEEAIRKLTFGQALVWGIPGRGLVRPGWAADLNIIDLDRLDLEMPELRHDLPGGAPNLSQRARGYTATVVNGTVLFRDGEHTGALPGRVLRNALAVGT